MFSLADHTLLYKTKLKISHGFVSEVSIFNKPATCWYIRVEWILHHCFQQLSTVELTLKMECDCYLSLQLGCTFWKIKLKFIVISKWQVWFYFEMESQTRIILIDYLYVELRSLTHWFIFQLVGIKTIRTLIDLINLIKRFKAVPK